MKKLKKTLSFCLIGGSLLASGQAFGGGWCNLDGCWELGVEALYWKPCTCDWQYGFASDQTQNNVDADHAVTVNAGYNWGFRLLGGYVSCDCCAFATLDWTHLNAKDASSAPRARVRTLTGTALQQVEADQRIRYNRVNLRGGQYLHRGCKFDLYTYVGIRWIDLDQTRTINALGANRVPLTARLDSQFDGAGLELGLGGEYRTRCGLSLLGKVAPTIALGRRKHSLRSEIDPATVSYASRTHCTPGLDFRLGFAYTWECQCAFITGEIGYELNYYVKILDGIDNWIEPSNQLGHNGGRGTVCENLGFGGPYASLRVRF